MLRSAFAARFTELVGEPVMQYLTRWRMLVATNAWAPTAPRWRCSRAGSATAPEAAFARAFKRVTGVAPGAIKRAGDMPDLRGPLVTSERAV